MRSHGILVSVLFLFVTSAFVVTAGCGAGDSTDKPPTTSIKANTSGDTGGDNLADTNAGQGTQSALPLRVGVNLFPEVVIKTSLGEITVRLNAEKSPVTVDNFLENYVKKGFYDGTIFHYVDKEYIAIGGGVNEDLTTKETRPVIRNEAENGLKNKRGTIAMNRDPEYPDSATSEFFFNLADNAELDHTDRDDPNGFGYCVFGEVTSGIDVLDRIGATPVHDTDQFVNFPTKAVVIESVKRLP